MCTCITLKDGSREYISGNADFIDLVGRELGEHAREYCASYFEEQAGLAEEMIGELRFVYGEFLNEIIADLKRYMITFPHDTGKLCDLMDKIVDKERTL